MRRGMGKINMQQADVKKLDNSSYALESKRT